IFVQLQPIKSDSAQQSLYKIKNMQMEVDSNPSKYPLLRKQPPLAFVYNDTAISSSAESPKANTFNQDRLAVIQHMIKRSGSYTPKVWVEVKKHDSFSPEFSSTIWVQSAPHVVHALDGPKVTVKIDPACST